MRTLVSDAWTKNLLCYHLQNAFYVVCRTRQRALIVRHPDHSLRQTSLLGPFRCLIVRCNDVKGWTMRKRSTGGVESREPSGSYTASILPHTHTLSARFTPTISSHSGAERKMVSYVVTGLFISIQFSRFLFSDSPLFLNQVLRGVLG